jgi:hypothetical protein
MRLSEDEKGSTENRMPKPLFNTLGKRQPRALVVGLRSVIKDPRATVAQRLEACKLLAIVEGYITPPASQRNPTIAEARNGSDHSPRNPAMINRLRELAGKASDKPLATDRPPDFRSRGAMIGPHPKQNFRYYCFAEAGVGRGASGRRRLCMGRPEST